MKRAILLAIAILVSAIAIVAQDDTERSVAEPCESIEIAQTYYDEINLKFSDEFTSKLDEAFTAIQQHDSRGFGQVIGEAEDIVKLFQDSEYPDCVSWAHERFATSMSKTIDAVYEYANSNQQGFYDNMLEARLRSGEARGYLYALGVELQEADQEE